MVPVLSPRHRIVLTAVALVQAGGCAPALDWREVRADGGSVVAEFPCRPVAQQRRVALAGTVVDMTIQACSADGMVWALSQADVFEAARVAAALEALRQTVAASIGAEAGPGLPWQVPGAATLPGGRWQRLVGVRPDGETVQVALAVFAHGSRVYRASVMSRAVRDEPARAFLDSLRVAA